LKQLETIQLHATRDTPSTARNFLLSTVQIVNAKSDDAMTNSYLVFRRGPLRTNPWILKRIYYLTSKKMHF